MAGIRKKFIFISAMIALLITAWLLFPDYSEQPASQHTQSAAATVFPQVSQKVKLNSAAPLSLVPNDVEGASLDTAIEMYKDWAQYPPDSRPLNEGQWDIMEPHIIPSAPRRLVTKQSDNQLHVSDYECTLQAQLHTVTEGATQLITLLCSTLPGEDKQVPPQIVEPDIKSVQLVLNTPQGVTIVNRSLSFNDRGRDGDEAASDRLYTLAFTPQEADWGEFDVSVQFYIAEENVRQKYELHTSFVASPKAPATFTGKIVDRIENGSLMVDVELHVKKPGRYRLFGNLKSAERYIAYSKQDVQLGAGIQKVTLHFFGKIFHDMGVADGSFTVVGIRGHRLNLAEVLSAQTEPEVEAIPNFESEFETQFYELTKFSQAEWDSPEKQQRLQDLQASANTQVSK